MTASASNESVSDREPFSQNKIDQRRLRWVRAGLMGIAAAYLGSCFFDAGLWFGADGWINNSRVSRFLEAAELQSEARWYLSPLWWTDSLVATYALLAAGVALSIAVAAQRVPTSLTWLVWFVTVAVANRYMMLASVAEAWLSMSLFGMAIASTTKTNSWWTGFGVTWMKIQFTALGIATALSMWSEETWRVGTGAIAMTQPASQRIIDWTESPLTSTLLHDGVSLYLIAAIPTGLWMLWTGRKRFGGIALVVWAILVALLGSHFLYAAVFAANVGMFLVDRDRSER